MKSSQLNPQPSNLRWTARNHDAIPKSQTSWALSWDAAQLDIQVAFHYKKVTYQNVHCKTVTYHHHVLVANSTTLHDPLN